MMTAMPDSTAILNCLACAALAWVAWLTLGKRKLSAPLPPGPAPLPIVGNVLDIPLRELWVRAVEWKQQFGDVCYLHVFGLGLVFLNSYEAAYDLMDSKGNLYSDRPHFTMAGELCGVENMVAFTSYGDQARRQRRLMARSMGIHSIQGYEPLIARETRAFLLHILDAPANWASHVRRYAGSLTLSAVYGYRVRVSDDKLLRLAEESVDLLANRIASTGSIWVVDIFPFLKNLPEWLPGMGFKRDARIWKQKMEEFVDVPYDYVKAQMARGEAHSSICSSILGQDGILLNAEQEFDLKWTANSMYGASIDSTITTISHLLLALIQHPEVLQQAQAEIDHVVGHDRLPTFADRPNLPYIECILSEALRFSAPVPMGLPHRLTEDNVYKGMFLPKGSLIFANNWAMTRDPALYPDPEVFRPERFLTLSHDDAQRADPRRFVFGFGRRRCPGAHLVESSLWLLVASIVATLDVAKARGAHGESVEPAVTFDNAVFRTPSRFECDIRPRSEKAGRLIREEAGCET